MLVESPFSEKSSARSILTRARRLGFLTFGKIRMILLCCKINNNESENVEMVVILSKSEDPSKSDVKNFFMELKKAEFGCLKILCVSLSNKFYG